MEHGSFIFLRKEYRRAFLTNPHAASVSFFLNLSCSMCLNFQTVLHHTNFQTKSMIQKLATRHRFTASTIITAILLAAPQLYAQAAPAKKSLLDVWVIDGGWTMLFIGAAVVAFIARTTPRAHETRPITETRPRQAHQGLYTILALSTFLTLTRASALGNGGMDGTRTEIAHRS